LLGIAGVVLGVISKKQIASGQGGGSGLALAGIICGGIGILLSIISGILGAVSALSGA
jgi:hypothetical protein